jgi:hypothetical protein
MQFVDTSFYYVKDIMLSNISVMLRVIGFIKLVKYWIQISILYGNIDLFTEIFSNKTSTTYIEEQLFMNFN